MEKTILDLIIEEIKEKEKQQRTKELYNKNKNVKKRLENNEKESNFIDDLVNSMMDFTEPHKAFKFDCTNAIKKEQDNVTKNISEEDKKVFNEIYNAKPKVDSKTNPLHYKTTNVETIDNIYNILGESAFYGYCIGNVIKYVSRYNTKNGVEDLEKARWYLSETIARMSGTDNEYRK